MVHIRKSIERVFRAQGRTVTWFVEQLCCTRSNVYKIFARENIDLYQLIRLSAILEHDFFADLSGDFNKKQKISFGKIKL